MSWDPAARFDELIHAPARLAIAALMAPAAWVEFRFVRDRTESSDSALSKQLATLANAGYVEVRKGAVAGRRATWFRLTPHGRASLEGHLLALEQIAADARRAASQPPVRPTETSAAAVGTETARAVSDGGPSRPRLPPAADEP